MAVLKYDLITPCADYRATVLCIVYTMYSTRPQPRRLQIYCSTPYTCTVLSLRNDLTELMTFQRTALIDAPVKWSVRRTYVESQKYTCQVLYIVYCTLCKRSVLPGTSPQRKYIVQTSCAPFCVYLTVVVAIIEHVRSRHPGNVGTGLQLASPDASRG